MKEFTGANLEKNLDSKSWKNKNSKYLFELQKLLDLAENIEDDELKKLIIYQMIKFDKTLTNISEEMFENIIKENKG